MDQRMRGRKTTLRGISWLNLRECLEHEKAKHPTELLFNTFDAHWNTNGHKVVFEQLSSQYEQRFPRAPVSK